MPSERRTLIAVPLGTVTVFFGGGGGGAAAAATTGFAAGFGAGGGGGAGLRAANSIAVVSSIRTSDTWPLSSSTRTALLSAPMKVPSTTLPDRRRTRSAEREAVRISAISAVTGRERRVMLSPLTSPRSAAQPRSANRSEAATGARP